MRIRFEKKSQSTVDLRVIAVKKVDFLNTRAKGHLALRQFLKREIGEHALDMLARQGFQAGHGECAVFNSARGRKSPAILLVSVDHEKEKETRARLDQFRTLGATISAQASQLGAQKIEIALDHIWVGENEPLEAFWEGLVLSRYEFKRYKTEKKKSKNTIQSIALLTTRPIAKGFVSRMEHLCESVMFARDLINMPPNDLRPTNLAAVCKKTAKESGLSIQLYDSRALTKMGAGGILCVGLGSDDQSYLARITYKPQNISKPMRITLVGKAVTFDSGGLVIKSSMDTMKCDMSGGAAVLATMKAVAALKLPLTVTAYIPIVENMINGQAFRPGDVFSLLCGKTVEVLNTDAEGRLILADALTLAARDKPAMIIDLATLTGACAAALGPKYAGLFSNNDHVARLLTEASDLSGEPLWRLPLAEEYRKLIYSDVADYKNLFKAAGAITASLFLEEFVDKTPWAHLDIAGPAFAAASEGVIRAGGVGFGVRTLIRLLENVANESE